MNHVIQLPENLNTEAEENPKKVEFIFMVASRTVIHKNSVDPKWLQLKICQRNNQRERAPEEFSPVSIKLTERFCLQFAGDKIVIPEELQKQVVDALHFGHPGSTKMLAESNVFC